MTERAGGSTDEQLRVGDADDSMVLKLLRRQVEVIKMIVQPLLSDIQANGNLSCGQRAFADASDGVGEGGHSIGSLVMITETVGRLDFMVRVGGAGGMDYGSPN